MYMVKQIYVSLEMTDREVKMLVSEYFNTRFNVLKVVKCPCDGIINYRIVNPDSIKRAIIACANEIKDKLGARLEKVILLIPPLNFKRIPLKVKVDSGEKGITKAEINKAFEMVRQVKVDPDVVIVNRAIVKYMINGISSRKFPENTNIEDCQLSIDLLCADRDLVYSYCCLVEECGIKILDICLTDYGIAKEASLFEKSYTNNIILLNMNYSSCSVTVLSKGKIAASKIVNIGLENYLNALKVKYPINESTLLRLLKYNSTFDNVTDDTLFAFPTNDGKYENITEKDLNDIVLPIISNHVDSIISETSSVIETGPTCFEITGDCSDIFALAKCLDDKTHLEVKVYHPETFGIRESGMTALIGSLFVKREIAELNDENIDCIDIFEFERIVDNSKINVEGETLTTKIKSLFEQYKKGENK